MARYSNIAIIYNPKSTGPSRRKAETLKRRLRREYQELPIKLIATEYAGHAEKLAYEIASAHSRPLIVSSSGDGGYNEVINGALQAQREGAHPICAVLPAGNANDHHRNLKSAPLAQAIKAHNLRSIDLLELTIHEPGGQSKTRYAHSYIGVGLTSSIARELNKTNATRWWEGWIFIKMFLRWQPVEIERNGQQLSIDSLVIGNVSSMAKILKIAKDAKPDDGRFEVVLMKHSPKPQFLRKVLKASAGTYRVAKTYERYEFKVLSKVEGQLDGELVPIPKYSRVVVRSAPNILTTVL